MAEKIRPEEVTTEVRQGMRIVDGHAVKEPEDYQDPDELYRYLIGHIHKYHPSADVSLIEKAYQLGAKPVTATDSTGWIYDPEGVFLEALKESLRWTRKRLRPAFCMMW